ncbi:MAG TPA: hypothetical protein VFP23_09685 [Solirubrobacterales bacterium]|nr:hypothetical protein [Solirubrobacterales bacterium]
MDDLRRLEAKGLARAKIRSRRRRVSTIRRRTVRGSLGLFALLWAIVFGQMVTGNDPALSRIRPHRAQAVAARNGGHPQQSGAVASSSAPPPETEAEAEAALEREREPESGFESEAAPEVESAPEPESGFEPESQPAPEPAPEPSPPVVTTAS